MNFCWKASLRLWAGSVEMMSTDWRTRASKIERIELQVVLPTPPLPPTKIHLSESCSSMFCTVPSGNSVLEPMDRYESIKYQCSCSCSCSCSLLLACFVYLYLIFWVFADFIQTVGAREIRWEVGFFSCPFLSASLLRNFSCCSANLTIFVILPSLFCLLQKGMKILEIEKYSQNIII